MDELTNEWGEAYRYAPCEFCGEETEDDGGCLVCEPRVDIEATPVRASFAVDATGAVSWAGWSADLTPESERALDS